MPEAIEKTNKLNEAIFSAKTKLNLPVPQIMDKELENLGKMDASQVQDED